MATSPRSLHPRYVCSDASTTRGEPMFATGSQVLGWVLVEVRGSWGKDAIHESEFGAHVPVHWKDDLAKRQIRAICIRSHLRHDAGDVRLFACVARRAGKGSAPLWTRDVASLADVVGAVDDLQVDQSPTSGWKHVRRPIVLVCTNGRHDQCCANLGRPLVRALRESPWAERVWECSHIGGDRFAANIVILPDSVYFGRVEPESAPALLAAFDEGRIDLAHYRGRTAFSLAEQAVEHFVRQELGVDDVDGLVIERRAVDGSFPVRVGGRRVAVRIGRRMMSVDEPLTCHGSPGQLVPVFTLESIT